MSQAGQLTIGIFFLSFFIFKIWILKVKVILYILNQPIF